MYPYECSVVVYCNSEKEKEKLKLYLSFFSSVPFSVLFKIAGHYQFHSGYSFSNSVLLCSVSAVSLHTVSQPG